MGYADASFADEPVGRRSMSGYVILINGAAIAYRSKKQSFAVSSTCESEIMALSSVVREIQALTRMLTDLALLAIATTTPVMGAPRRLIYARL